MPVERIIHHLSSMPHCSGVYRMTDAENKDLYIGKAKNLAKRVASYTRLNKLSHRLRQMVHHAENVRIFTTDTESEALILEAQLIKKHRPPYNILLKDRNAFSYILLTDHDFPRITTQRQVSSEKNTLSFGPFLSYSSMKPLMDIIHHRFQLRSCTDADFARRARPCLQYYIKKCSAPCVQKVQKQEYDEQVNKALKLLRGQKQALIRDLEQSMHQAAQDHRYDKAHGLHKQIQSLNTLSDKQSPLQSDDLVVIGTLSNTTCLYIVSFRHNTFYGAENFFFHGTSTQDHNTIIGSFFKKFYTKNSPPRRLVLPFPIDDIQDIKTIAQHFFHQKPQCFVPKKGHLKREIDKMQRQCLHALQQHLSTQKTAQKALSTLYEMLAVMPASRRIEIYDNSHHQGHSAFSAMVVVHHNAFSPKDYRLFSMNKGPDDYDMMRQAIQRRFGHAWPHPDIIVVDGGKGQVSAAQEALNHIGLSIPVIGVVKTHPHDSMINSQGQSIHFAQDDPVLHMLQRWRDEAHRFAIRNHRLKKSKSFLT